MCSTLRPDTSWFKAASFVLIALVLASCGTRKSTVSGYHSTPLQDDILTYSRKHLGKPYRYSGKGPGAFDCSGFTSFVFRNFGYRLNSSSSGQDRQVPSIAKREDLRKGDLVFFEGRRKNGNVGHVGIVLELLPSGQFKFIHASTTSGVIISSSTEPYYASRYLRGGRVLEENASYVTRQNPATAYQQKTLSTVSAEHSATCPTIPEVVPTVVATRASDAGTEGSQPVIMVQTDPSKIPPLQPNASKGSSGEKETSPKSGRVVKANSDLILSEKNSSVPSPPTNHMVKTGETLYSISRQYGCSVEQLRTWNPQLTSVLKTGETLLVYGNRPE